MTNTRSMSAWARVAALAIVVLFNGCAYEPRVPEASVSCAATKACPEGFACYRVPGPAAEALLCCKIRGCGLGGEPVHGDAGGRAEDAPQKASGGRAGSGTGGAGGGAGGADAASPEALAPAPPDASDASHANNDGPGGPAETAVEVAPPADAPAAEAPVDRSSGRCPASIAGPRLVHVQFGPAAFCIDATEVSNTDYLAFLASNPTPGGQAAVCSWNTSFNPPNNGDVRWPFPAAEARRPVVNVDWCDAAAYCKWAKKRLCGRIGGGKLGTASARDYTMAEWSNACTGSGTTRYPYGTTFNPAACNTEATRELGSAREDVGSRPSCEGGTKGLFDMSGNVEEWIDACDGQAGASDKCTTTGTSAYRGNTPPEDITCVESDYTGARREQYELRGFRCCADVAR